MHDWIPTTWHFGTPVLWIPLDSLSLLKFLRRLSTLFSFLLLLFTTYASCLLMCYTCCYVHELYISLCLLFRIIPSMWVIVPAKPWWSIETFGMLIPPKDGQNGRTALVSNLLDVLASIVCPDNKSVFFLLSAFSQSGYLPSAVFPIHWFVFAYHFFAVFNSLPTKCCKWCTRCSEKPPLLFLSVVFPFSLWIRLLNNRKHTEFLGMHHFSACPGCWCHVFVFCLVFRLKYLII